MDGSDGLGCETGPVTSAGGLDVGAPTPGGKSAIGVVGLGAGGAKRGLDPARYDAAGNSRLALRGGLLAAAIAAALGVIALFTGLSGGDIAAAVYRVDLFRRVGFTLWDNSWYAGHWTLSYSVLLGPVGAALGIPLTEVACAAVAAATNPADRGRRTSENHRRQGGRSRTGRRPSASLAGPGALARARRCASALAGADQTWSLSAPVALAAPASTAL